MATVNITLEEMLRARDRRAAAQQRLLRVYGMPLVSFTLNIAGPVKTTPLTELAFDGGLRALYAALEQPIAEEIIRSATGCEALLVYDCSAEELKKICLELEAAAPIGRLYDLDVLDADGEKLSRPVPRTCLVCGGAVTVCSRSRAHGLTAITGRTQSLLEAYAADCLTALVTDAMEREVRLTPKPGLVDARNSGAHDDMDLPLFLKSIRALAPYLRQTVLLGLRGADAAELQALGQEAEAAMFRATDGVNTHKGALYSFSILLAALGYSLAEGGSLFDHAAAAAGRLLRPQATHGAAVAMRYGVGGVRAEALNGFPTARRAAQVLADHDPLTALAWLMVHTEDSNLYHRGGVDGVAFVRERAAAILRASPQQRQALMRELDDMLILRRLSPGGCADLLALAFFLRRLREIPALSAFCV